MRLEEIGQGQAVFIDANIFIYHLTGRSVACRAFLERCEVGEIRGFTGAHVMLEVLHRLMMLEAVQRGLLPPGNLAQRLKEHPQVVKALSEYGRHASRIPEMRIEILNLDWELIQASQEVRLRTGLLVYDSIIVAMMERARMHTIATQDHDFLDVPDLQVCMPEDI